VIRQAETDGLKSWVERSFGHAFKDAELLQAALTHRSAGGEHNERLEFLGDSVLNCAVARLLYDAHPGADEGALSRLRATLVSGETLAQLAADLGLGEHLRLGAGELKSGGYRRASTLADALEALVGAIFVEAGFDAAAAAVKHVIGRRLEELPTADALKDPKTRLQETLQAQGLALPVYALTAASGDPHAQLFTVTCEVPTFGLLAIGKGGSRRSAEQSAARKLLDLLPGDMGKSS
jgi:ribonuclease III